MKREKGKDKRSYINNSLIVCNGVFSKKLLNKFLKPDKQFIVIACDGAANTIRKYFAVPDVIIGDLDSITPKVLTYYRNKKVKVKKVIDQNKTDLEKAIEMALKLKLKNIAVIGYGGKRIDHTINNFSILKKYSPKCNLRFIDNEFEIFFANKTEDINYRKNELISLIGLPVAAGIKSKGLKWNLKDQTLEFGKLQSALNMTVSDSVKITVGKGSLLVFKKHFENYNQIFISS